jgi:hypothetical protein
MKIDQATWKLWKQQGRLGIYVQRQQTREHWNTKGLERAVDRVNRGARLLDQREPNWVNRVVPGDLNMASGEFCIVGQTYGRYHDRVHIPFAAEKYDVSERRQENHGFMASGTVPFSLLDRVWVYLLAARKEATTAHTPFYLEAPAHREAKTPAPV